MNSFINKENLFSYIRHPFMLEKCGFRWESNPRLEWVVDLECTAYWLPITRWPPTKNLTENKSTVHGYVVGKEGIAADTVAIQSKFYRIYIFWPPLHVVIDGCIKGRYYVIHSVMAHLALR